MADEVLLSISEAAKLIQVCENTLRDWDIEGKFKAQRTDGGHRRYGLDLIRDFISKKENKELIQMVNKWENDGYVSDTKIRTYNFPLNHDIPKLVNKWESLGYLLDIEKEKDKNCMAILLENCLSSRNMMSNPIFSTEQALWLTKESWARCKFKGLLSVQPMTGPTCLSFFIEKDESNNSLKIESEAVSAKTVDLNFKFFNKANFDSIKDVYVDTIASEIDGIIFNLIEKNNTLTEDFLNTCAYAIKSICDYLIAPQSIIEKIPKDRLTDIDVFEIPTILNPNTFSLLFCAGKYPESNFSFPILHPFVIFQEVPCFSFLSYTSSCMLRFGSLSKK